MKVRALVWVAINDALTAHHGTLRPPTKNPSRVSERPRMRCPNHVVAARKPTRMVQLIQPKLSVASGIGGGTRAGADFRVKEASSEAIPTIPRRSPHSEPRITPSNAIGHAVLSHDTETLTEA